MSKIRPKICLALAGASVLAAATVISALPASAAPTSSCPVGNDTGVDCIFYLEAYDGSHTGVYDIVSNFPVSGSTSYVFLTSGTGKGSYLGNDNGSNRNTDTGTCPTIYYSTGYSGPALSLNKYGLTGYEEAGSGLGSLLNNIRSQNWSASRC